MDIETFHHVRAILAIAEACERRDMNPHLSCTLYVENIIGVSLKYAIEYVIDTLKHYGLAQMLIVSRVPGIAGAADMFWLHTGDRDTLIDETLLSKMSSSFADDVQNAMDYLKKRT